MIHIYNDGGRAAAGYKGTTGDCACRAIAIATERSYQEIYELLDDECANVPLYERIGYTLRLLFQIIPKTCELPGTQTASTGVLHTTTCRVLKKLGWSYIPIFGTSVPITTCASEISSMHLNSDELPSGRIVVQIHRHLVAVINGAMHDTGNQSLNGRACVYGYYTKETT